MVWISALDEPSVRYLALPLSRFGLNEAYMRGCIPKAPSLFLPFIVKSLRYHCGAGAAASNSGLHPIRPVRFGSGNNGDI